MDAVECIKTRRSVRKYLDREIDRETMNQILDSVRYAPSWKNTQVVRYSMVTDKERINAIADAVLGYTYNTKTIQRAQVLAVQSVVKGVSGYEQDGSFSTDKGSGWQMYDAGISAQTFCLAAHSFGIGTVIRGVVDDVKIHEILDLPDDEMVTSVIAMGYPVEDKPAPKRKEVEEIARFI
ncbi:MAG: nitroreductase family protein [Lachnospiraceae bacterium]|nr:nitroreductase family protein [Lachnospiraceae bacterium]